MSELEAAVRAPRPTLPRGPIASLAAAVLLVGGIASERYNMLPFNSPFCPDQQQIGCDGILPNNGPGLIEVYENDPSDIPKLRFGETSYAEIYNASDRHDIDMNNHVFFTPRMPETKDWADSYAAKLKKVLGEELKGSFSTENTILVLPTNDGKKRIFGYIGSPGEVDKVFDDIFEYSDHKTEFDTSAIGVTDVGWIEDITIEEDGPSQTVEVRISDNGSTDVPNSPVSINADSLPDNIEEKVRENVAHISYDVGLESYHGTGFISSDGKFVTAAHGVAPLKGNTYSNLEIITNYGYEVEVDATKIQLPLVSHPPREYHSEDNDVVELPITNPGDLPSGLVIGSNLAPGDKGWILTSNLNSPEPTPVTTSSCDDKRPDSSNDCAVYYKHSPDRADIVAGASGSPVVGENGAVAGIVVGVSLDRGKPIPLSPVFIQPIRG